MGRGFRAGRLLVLGVAAATLAACVVPPPGPTTGREWYVDASLGSDSGAGTAADPLRTIGAAVAQVVAGDTVRVRPGDYRGEGQITVSVAGTLQDPVRVERDGQGEVTVDRILVTNSAWVQIRDLTVVGSKSLPPAWLDMPDVVVDDPSITIDPNESWSTRAAKVQAKYATWSTFQSATGQPSWEIEYFSAGIDVVTSNFVTITGNDVSRHTVCIRLRNASSFAVVDGNTVHHCLDGIRGDKRSFDAFSFQGAYICSNQVEQNFRYGIMLNSAARANIVTDNTVRYSGHNQIATYAAGDSNRIQRNDVADGGYYSETMRYPGSSAISVHSAGPGTTVDSNTIAYHVDPTMRDGNGVIIDYTPQGATVVNNTVYRVMGSGVSSVHSAGSTIIHNTIVEAGLDTTSMRNGVGIRFFGVDDVNSVVANNIIDQPHNGGISFEAGTLTAQAYVDHNLFDTDGTPLIGNGLTPDVLYYTLDELRAIGYGQHDLDADPLLADPPGGAFEPLEGSPARGSGTPAYSTPLDASGAPRSATTPTIGAFE